MATAVDVAGKELSRMIAAGELAPGAPLPSEAELCERFGVSRSSLREARKMLTTAGVLESRPNGRTTVSGMGAADLVRPLGISIPLLPLDRYLSLFTLREVLEGHCAAQAAAKLTVQQATDLLSMAKDLRGMDPGDDAQLLDSSFHRAIIKGANDAVIEALMEVLRKRGRDYNVYEHEDHAALKSISDEAHMEIAQAIVNRDPEGARFMAMRHVRTTRSWLEQFRPPPALFEDEEL